ncbi:4-carboxymuconolactone decarboxylase [Azorhizobium oxalatiphilum]|uniref:4-carboxymuconolactone decarboxylase n=1 Tax=Azorhizobium oxalatiphilum TaxID=980631 RepID=A0A917CB86_9HYPH|nr:carboxymuconolactone decarboxylase family protein [Azorhizobium oxalatiphilum]GGF77915.1 4-carboxymuconolactone decarboxylase [Azorhizobium oxalatiphilum]
MSKIAPSQDAPRPLFDTGLAIRKEVLGAEYVERAIAGADDFSRPLQEMVTEYCWGNIWGRPGLDRRTRSLLNIAMLSALNRPHELKLHLKGALTNGATREEIRETILQIGVYCGVPVAIETNRLAQEVFRTLDAEEG